MKIALQDTVCTIHGAEGTNVKNLISAAGIESRARALFDEVTLVARQQQNLLADLNRIFCAGNLLKQLVSYLHHAERNIKTRHNLLDHREINNIFVNQEF